MNTSLNDPLVGSVNDPLTNDATDKIEAFASMLEISLTPREQVALAIRLTRDIDDPSLAVDMYRLANAAELTGSALSKARFEMGSI